MERLFHFTESSQKEFPAYFSQSLLSGDTWPVAHCFRKLAKAFPLPGTLLGERRVNTALESALPAIEGVDYRSVTKIKQLLALIIRNGPLKPNVSDMARFLDVSRDSIYSWLTILENIGLVHNIWLHRTGNTRRRKPDLILPGDPSMLQFAGNRPRPHAVRMTFLICQLAKCRIRMLRP